MKKTHKEIKLNYDEKDILNSFEKGEWNSVRDFEKQKNIAKTAAKNILGMSAKPVVEN